MAAAADAPPLLRRHRLSAIRSEFSQAQVLADCSDCLRYFQAVSHAIRLSSAAPFIRYALLRALMLFSPAAFAFADFERVSCGFLSGTIFSLHSCHAGTPRFSADAVYFHGCVMTCHIASLIHI